MATTQTLVNRALRLLGVISSGESPTSDESNDALTALNAMLDSWRNDRLMVYSLNDVSKTLVAGDSSYTIYPSTGDFSTTRPVIVHRAYVRLDTTDLPVRVVTDSEWFAIRDKTVTSDVPEVVWYNPTMTAGTVNVWPVPSSTNVLHLVLWTPLASLALSDTIALPPGYEKAISYNLAIECAPEFQVEPRPSVVKGATESLAGIKRRNAPRLLMRNELSQMFNAHVGDIQAGE